MRTWSETNYKNVSDNVIKRVDNYRGLSSESKSKERKGSVGMTGEIRKLSAEKRNRKKGNIY